MSNHDGLYKTNETPVRRRIYIPQTGWAMSQAARMVMQECEIPYTIVHKIGSMVIEAWFEPGTVAEEHFERARQVVTTACFLIAHDKTSTIAPLTAARSVVDRSFVRFFANQESF